MCNGTIGHCISGRVYCSLGRQDIETTGSSGDSYKVDPWRHLNPFHVRFRFNWEHTYPELADMLREGDRSTAKARKARGPSSLGQPGLSAGAPSR